MNRIISLYYSENGNTLDLILEHTGFFKNMVCQDTFRNYHLFRNLLCKNPNLKLSHMELLAKIEIYDFFNYTIIDSYTLFNFCKLKNIKFKWNMYSCNKNIKLSFLEKYIEKNWYFEKLSENENIPLEFIYKYPHKKWDLLKILKSRKNSSEISKILEDQKTLHILINEKKQQKELIKTYKQTSLAELLSYNLFTPLEFFLENREDKNLCWDLIAQNNNLTIDFVKTFKKWLNWFAVSKNSKINMKIVSENLDLPWNWFGLSQNINLNIDFLLTHKNEKWDWFYVSKNSGIKMCDIKNNINLSWDWYKGVSVNPNLTTNDILQFASFNLNWKEISCHPNVDMEFLENNRHSPLYHSYISENPNLTLEFISKHNKGAWNFFLILKNKFLYDTSCIRYRKILHHYIKKRREMIKNVLTVPEDIKKVILFYIGA